MDKKDLVYRFIKTIPRGKVITYGKISDYLKINSPRLVGQIIHQNKDSANIPCHRVVFADGSLSKRYAFGGIKKQKSNLINEGIKFVGNKVDLRLSRFNIPR